MFSSTVLRVAERSACLYSLLTPVESSSPPHNGLTIDIIVFRDPRVKKLVDFLDPGFLDKHQSTTNGKKRTAAWLTSSSQRFTSGKTVQVYVQVQVHVREPSYDDAYEADALAVAAEPLRRQNSKCFSAASILEPVVGCSV